ncbi:hypothetical protein HNR19_003139 [Nocardioides thalensis]|uniref:YbjN domain-containing protein n=1 Tax=Nocardioides thalensis TaxID=1914755 RepID=A0A853C5K5_9ACTN|nr:hypothetical protein [Nocardioides thalensis]NYJ02441.1 hypothetical protein [Nocardioides thalensis]
MTVGTKVDLDRATRRAWRAMERDLAVRIAELDTGEPLLLELEGPDPDDGCTPYVQVLCSGDAATAEVSSNHYLASRYRLDKEARRALRASGWEKPNEHTDNYWWPMEAGCEIDAADAAAMIVAVLRDVFGVPHPSFLIDSDDVVETDDEDFDATPTCRGMSVDAGLRAEIEAALAANIGHTPSADDDGDYGFILDGHSVVFVRPVEGQMPVARIFAELVVGVTDPGRAAFEVAVLNRDCRWAKFVLVGDRIMLRTEILAEPFSPEHLSFLMGEICEFVTKTAPDTAHRVGGRCFLSVAEDQS